MLIFFLKLQSCLGWLGYCLKVEDLVPLERHLNIVKMYIVGIEMEGKKKKGLDIKISVIILVQKKTNKR